MKGFRTHNAITLLRNGAAYFPALEAAINAAQHEIYIQSYIFEIDAVGSRIGEALKNAALRHVYVFLLLDGFGCKDLPKSYIKSLEAAGVEVLLYRPKISPWTLKRSRLRRMHRKVTVIDGRIGFVGGINIIDDYNTPPNEAPRIDYAVQVTGPLINDMRQSAMRLWKTLCRVHLRPQRQSILGQSIVQAAAGEVQAKLLLRDQLRHRNEIENAYLAAIRAAQSTIIIANAYFLPGRRFRRALGEAAARGVNVVLLLQGRVEIRLLHYASHALYEAMLRQGIHIYEYRKSFMHSKVAVIDDAWAMVGSSNIDPFSLLMAREANIEIRNADFAQLLKSDLHQTIASGAGVITYDNWQKKPALKRAVYWLVYGFVRFLMSVIGYSNHY